MRQWGNHCVDDDQIPLMMGALNSRLHDGSWTFALSALTLCSLLANVQCAADWPQYRGANHDGTSTEKIRTNWNEKPPRQIWKVRLDPALSSFAVSGGKAYTQVRRRVAPQDQEFCIALNADTGQEIWASPPLDIAFYPNGGVGFDDGPRSTPSVDGDRVVVLTSYLNLVCLNAATGQEVWRHDLKAEYGSRVIEWQNAASPIIEGDVVIVNANAPNQCLMAFRKQDGSLVWKGQNDAMTQATPVVASIGGVRQVIFYAQSGLVSVVPETGVVLWRHPVNYNGTSVAASPIVAGALVYCSRAYPTFPTSAKAGGLAIKLSNSAGTFTVDQLWYRVNEVMNHWCTPVHHNGYLYGMFGHGGLQFECVELATGAEKWAVDGFGYGSVLVVDGKILAASESGELVLVEPTPIAFTETARFRALNGKCWNVPAVSDGRIYFRSTTEAVCLDVAAVRVLSRLTLKPAISINGTLFRLSILTEDGSPLDPGRAPNIDVFTTTDLGMNANGWTKLTSATTLINGQLQLEDPLDSDHAQRFYRVEEKP